jgi:hypothetical protein
MSTSSESRFTKVGPHSKTKSRTAIRTSVERGRTMVENNGK